MKAIEGTNRHARFVGAVGLAITGGGTLPQIMQRCCQAAVDHLGAALARIWVLDSAERVLMLTGSAGLCAQIEDPDARVALATSDVVRIAAERRPFLSNDVMGDLHVSRHEWIEREGFVSFAGWPLVLWDETVGVLEMFAREELGAADFEALGTAATGIAVTISSIRHLEGERRARAAAEEANRTKSEFLATMSHELRTPLNAIGGYVELLDLGIRGPVTAEQRADLARILQSQQHLLGLINQILDLAKDDAGALRVDRAAIRTGDTVDAALSLVRPQAAAKALTLSDVCGGSADARYIGDEPRVRQVLVNLLGNAVKFTQQGGRISVDCGLTESPPPDALLTNGAPYVGLRVVDTGVGIPPDQLGRIFEPFTQVEATASRYARPAGGTGLGLAISRRLSRLMGGDLTVQSQPGVGSTFTLWLPALERRARPRRSSVEAAAEHAATDTDRSKSSVRGGGSDRHGSEFAVLADRLMVELRPILRAWVARLRTELPVPDLERLDDEELENHAASFVLEVALALRVLDASSSGERLTSIRDGTAIMNLVGERHGAQRARLGWSEEAVLREYALLSDEIDIVVRRPAPSVSAATLDRARQLVKRLVEYSTRVSLGGHRLEDASGRSVDRKG